MQHHTATEHQLAAGYYHMLCRECPVAVLFALYARRRQILGDQLLGQRLGATGTLAPPVQARLPASAAARPCAASLRPAHGMHPLSLSQMSAGRWGPLAMTIAGRWTEADQSLDLF